MTWSQINFQWINDYLDHPTTDCFRCDSIPLASESKVLFCHLLSGHFFVKAFSIPPRKPLIPTLDASDPDCVFEVKLADPHDLMYVVLPKNIGHDGYRQDVMTLFRDVSRVFLQFTDDRVRWNGFQSKEFTEGYTDNFGLAFLQSCLTSLKDKHLCWQKMHLIEYVAKDEYGHKCKQCKNKK